ncbi:rhodanese-like domain-containing protein [Haloferula sargassicola]|uniref:Thiosulfate sulfurtransferase GlpE n=1 Tax=Haloferula sargassicola TaxID=490096 RepID=A0ABP9UUF3_9BACT
MKALPDPASAIEVGPAEVAALTSEIGAGQVLLIDCREPDEWRIAHLPGARLVPLSGFSTGAEDLIAAGLPCIIYCHHGMRSLQAVRFLRSRGVAQAWSMTGGIDQWSREVDPALARY